MPLHLHRPVRVAVFLGALCTAGALTSAWVADQIGRREIATLLARAALDHARSLARYAAAAGSSDSTEELVESVREAWSDAELPQGYLDVVLIAPDGTYLLHSGHPERVGTHARYTRLVRARSEQPGSLADLLSRPEDWAGHEEDAEGRSRIAAYAHEPRLGALVGIQLRPGGFESWVSRTRLPWLTALAAVFGVLLPLTLVLIHRSWSGAQRRLAEAEHAERVLLARLAQNERLASLGTLAAGLAHEINNPLTYVLGNAEYLERVVPPTLVAEPPDVRARVVAALAEVREGSERVAAIVRDLRGFVRPEQAEVAGPVDARDAVEHALRLAAPEIRRHAHLERRYLDAPAVPGPRGRLEQIVLNLLTNAVHALDLTSETPHRISVSIAPDDDGRTVRITVEDDGPGMPPEVLGRIFDPFYTTKAPGRGTGLGLFVSRQLAESLGGSLEIRSARGQGTTAVLLLPAWNTSAAGA